jgi:hypothetical protein
VRCGETAELEGREPIVITPLHLSRYPKGIREKERFWLEERRKRVRGYDKQPGREEPHKLRGYMKTRQECVGPRAGKDRVCISLYGKMMYIYLGVSRIYILPVAQCTPVIHVSLLTFPRPPASPANVSSGGEKRILPPQLLLGPLCEAHLSSSISHKTLYPNSKELKNNKNPKNNINPEEKHRPKGKA